MTIVFCNVFLFPAFLDAGHSGPAYTQWPRSSACDWARVLSRPITCHRCGSFSFRIPAHDFLTVMNLSASIIPQSNTYYCRLTNHKVSCVFFMGLCWTGSYVVSWFALLVRSCIVPVVPIGSFYWAGGSCVVPAVPTGLFYWAGGHVLYLGLFQH